MRLTSERGTDLPPRFVIGACIIAAVRLARDENISRSSPRITSVINDRFGENDLGKVTPMNTGGVREVIHQKRYRVMVCRDPSEQQARLHPTFLFTATPPIGPKKVWRVTGQLVGQWTVTFVTQEAVSAILGELAEGKSVELPNQYSSFELVELGWRQPGLFSGPPPVKKIRRVI